MKILKKSVFQYIGNTGTENWPTSEMKADIDENGNFKLEMSMFNSSEFFSNETQREEVIDFMTQVLDKAKELADEVAARYKEN
ncbi:hypothetical protein NGA84_06985 [Lactococcus formosensis]|uniref:Uncharacterized protein n=1 Tax=Lactococcus formosensis TaxID=1281486 RepID=A0A9X4P5Q2_9LACT|nr:hypothetical protein [Lactococcus formosensis]MDG6143091.1 hypothetical protein [Lactococcus formosensis]MDG6160343.1 hypothetical protein [Lactococcus formosensis]MDG6193554.1 hypothetical protein [Lactococcus formosensis]